MKSSSVTTTLYDAAVATLPPELRQVQPESFVATRDALSRRLRQAGDREAAEEVRRLRRPSSPLWALNQLAAATPDRVTELIQAGEALRETTQQALQGGQAGLGRLSSAHARLVDRLTGEAMELLARLPAPATSETRSRIWTMLRVASLDPALASGLAEGSLAEEPMSTGFDSLLGFDLGTAPSRAVRDRPASPPPTKAGGKEPSNTARRRREHAEEVRAATARMEAARQEAAGARKRLELARARLADLRKQARAAEREVDGLQSEVDHTERSAEAAQEALEGLRAAENNG